MQSEMIMRKSNYKLQEKDKQRIKSLAIYNCYNKYNTYRFHSQSQPV
uniref:Uncharacterized protein n=1 Tax=Staphylococcus phage HS13 TaxID=3056403 RepID=A0AA49X4N8_9VIRU|nr:MAG: hypothetical protein [Staphylococcus phage HS13]DAI53249.1 MAG TPA: hypothetical protein [Caudoviricetes sp.]